MSSTTESGEFDIVEVWLRKDPKRWIAGALAGLFATVVMLAFAMVLYAALGMEAWFPVKMAALPFLGNAATEFGMNAGAIICGFLAHAALGVILGMIFAHFTGTNSLPALLGMGFVWGVFSWIFVHNLFIQSFTAIKASHLSPGTNFFVTLVFGLALTSVAFFDRALRGGDRR